MSRHMLMLGMGTALLGGSGDDAAPPARRVERAGARPQGSLVEAVRQGARARVELLLEQGADPDERDPETGWTPLMYAFELGRRDVALLLLRAKRAG